MIRYLLRRLFAQTALLVVAASCAYLLAATALDPRGNYADRQPPPDPRVVEEALSEYNLNDRVPLVRRYAVWASGVVRGDLGRTWDGASVGEEMSRRVGVSLRLMTLGFAAGLGTGVLLSLWAVLRRDGWVDRFSAVLALVVISVPTVVLAVALQNAAVGVNAATGVEVFRFTGEYTPGPDTAGVLQRAQHLLLPTLTVALPLAAVFARYQRGVMADLAGAPFVRAARARGLGRTRALVRHALRPALLPLVTYAGLTFAMMFTGLVFAESVFGWHGVGSYLITSLDSGDVNSVAAVGCFTAVSVVVLTAVSDLLHAVLDPRLRGPAR